MSVIRTARTQKLLSLVAAISVLATCLTGCGGSSQEMQLPEQGRKIVDRRKVDVEQRPAPPKSATGKSNSRSGR